MEKSFITLGPDLGLHCLHMSHKEESLGLYGLAYEFYQMF